MVSLPRWVDCVTHPGPAHSTGIGSLPEASIGRPGTVRSDSVTSREGYDTGGHVVMSRSTSKSQMMPSSDCPGTRAGPCHVGGLHSRWKQNGHLVVGVVIVVAVSVLGVHALPAGAAGGGRPLISSVTISGTSGDYSVVVRGHGLGGPTVPLPFLGDVSNFRIGDDAQPGQGEWGYTGDSHPLQYTKWTPSEVEVGGLGAHPGDALVVALWNGVTARGVTWGGNVPPVTSSTPTIKSVGFSSLGTPVDLRIVVKGKGFGPAPVALPFVGDLDSFSFWDGRAHCGSSAAFTAGGEYFGQAPADAVTLRYESWSDTKIVIGGFRGSYGTGCAKVDTGDPVAVSVWNSADASAAGPQTAKRGLILYGIPGN